MYLRSMNALAVRYENVDFLGGTICMKGGKALIKRAIFCVLVFLLLALSGSAQKISSLTRLTAEDVQMIIQEEARSNPRALATLAKDPEQRKKVLENLKQALAVAGEAERTGFADQPEIKTQLALAEAEILATAYDNKLKADAGKPNDPGPPFGYIDDKDVNAFFDAPANKSRYDAELEKFFVFLQEMQKKASVPQEMTDEQKQFITAQWKKVTYGAAKAREMNLADRKIELQYKLQQALILARTYSQEKLEDQLTPTGEEIKAYIAANPKFDKAGKRAKAEEILAKVKAGGNFADLANEFSEDPGNKDQKTGAPLGGLYDWKGRSVYVKEFSDAAWALEAGQTSGIVETQFGYHVIKLEGKRKVKNEEQVKVRHILISTTYKGESDSGMPMTLEEGAKQELSREKQKKVIDDILLRNPIDLPADFAIVVPAGPGAETGCGKIETPETKRKK